jgi:hypothetical protein
MSRPEDQTRGVCVGVNCRFTHVTGPHVSCCPKVEGATLRERSATARRALDMARHAIAADSARIGSARSDGCAR